MFQISFPRLMREWVALLAIFAMALGPLSLAVSRGLSAQERVNIAAGLASLPICAPGVSADGLTSQITIECEHCLPASGAAPQSLQLSPTPFVVVGLMMPAPQGPGALLQGLGLPPATGPPFLM